MILIHTLKQSPDQIDKILKAIGNRPYSLLTADYESTLAKLEQSAKDNPVHFESVVESDTNPKDQDDLLIFYLTDMDRDEISSFYNALEENQVKNFQCSAKTETNQNWTLAQLCEELKNEERFFELQEQILDLVSKMDKVRFMKDQQYAKFMSMAAQMAQDPELSLDVLEAVVPFLKELMASTPSGE